MEVYFKNLTPEEGAASKLLHDLNDLDLKSEEFFRTSQVKPSEKSRENFAKGLQRVKAACRALEKNAASEPGWMHEPVREMPYTTVGIAFGLGMLAAILIWPRLGRARD